MGRLFAICRFSSPFQIATASEIKDHQIIVANWGSEEPYYSIREQENPNVFFYATTNSRAAFITDTSTGIIRSRSRSVSAVTTIAMTAPPRMSAG